MVALEEGRCAHYQIIQSGLEQMFLCPIAWLTYAKCGSIEDAIRVFNEMPSQNVVTWNAILGGCAMHGLLISAKLEHYTCMVDLLGCAGHLQESEQMVMAMPCEPDVAAWMALLSACKIHEEEKVFHLCHHSEKLAIAFGLIYMAPGTLLWIRKNLWDCEDCHTSTKFISEIVGKTIMVKDANCFHHFEDGVCSCMDYW
ncbi:unnamed protein product [Sphagnum compactum]